MRATGDGSRSPSMHPILVSLGFLSLIAAAGYLFLAPCWRHSSDGRNAAAPPSAAGDHSEAAVRGRARPVLRICGPFAARIIPASRSYSVSAMRPIRPAPVVERLKPEFPSLPIGLVVDSAAPRQQSQGQQPDQHVAACRATSCWSWRTAMPAWTPLSRDRHRAARRRLRGTGHLSVPRRARRAESGRASGPCTSTSGTCPWCGSAGFSATAATSPVRPCACAIRRCARSAALQTLANQLAEDHRLGQLVSA